MREINLNTNPILTNASSAEAQLQTEKNLDASIFENEISNEENQTNELTQLTAEFKEAQDKQGVIGKLWNGLKNSLGFGLGSNKVEEKIEDYKNGKISYDEAFEAIENFESKQENMVNIVANSLTGVAAAGIGIATCGAGAIVGGAAIGSAIIGGAATGGIIKAGVKTLDRATNEVENDVLDGKQILKDGITGAVDGTVSVLTAGMIKGPVFNQAIGTAVKQGVIQGAKAGAISGAATGATEYSVEAAFEEDVDFSFDELLGSTARNAAAGGIMGGALGGITGGLKQKSFNNKRSVIHSKKLGKHVDNSDQAERYIKNYNNHNESKALTGNKFQETASTLEDLSKKAETLELKFDSQLDDSAKQVYDVFEENDDIAFFSARSKGQESIHSKLSDKYINGKLESTDMQECYDAIADAIGTRVQLKSLSEDVSREVTEDVLKNSGINASYDDFIKFMNNDSSLDKNIARNLEPVKEEVLDALKTRQTQSVVDQLKESIKNGNLKIEELNNYGDEITSYFTNKQVLEITDSYKQAVENQKISNKKFKIVNKQKLFGEKEKVVAAVDEAANAHDIESVIDIAENSDKAVKSSGYSASQINTKHVLSDGTVANGELQIRGTKVNDFAEVEHVPYDIRQGKLSAQKEKYSELIKIFEQMDDNNFDQYNKYLSDTYKSFRRQELGLWNKSCKMPNLADYLTGYGSETISKINADGLFALSKLK